MCYQLPAIMMDGVAIVISPLIALMKNQVDAIRGFVEGGDSIAHFLNSSLNKSQVDAVHSDILSVKRMTCFYFHIMLPPFLLHCLPVLCL